MVEVRGLSFLVSVYDGGTGGQKKGSYRTIWLDV